MAATFIQFLTNFIFSGALDLSFSEDDIHCKSGFKISFSLYGLNSMSVLCIKKKYIFFVVVVYTLNQQVTDKYPNIYIFSTL